MVKKSKIAIIGLGGLVLLAALAYGYRTSSGTAAAKAKGPAAVPVLAAAVEVRDVPVQLRAVGRAEAYESVTLKARVDGQVAAADYTEGQPVRSGAVLVRLDPRDFAARLKQAEANLARDKAQLAKARVDVARYVSLKERGFVSDEKVSEFRTAEAAAAATVSADRAAVELARLQLSYATIRAPFDGVAGARLVFPGSSVKVNETALAVVNRVQPLYVTFAVPEKHLPSLRESLRGGGMKAVVTLPGNTGPRFEGPVKFLDNAVDVMTGTIQMKAVLDNARENLMPGQFLNVMLTLDVLKQAVVVPKAAVQQGSDGNFVFVVKPGNTAEVRKVSVRTTYEGWAAIGQGLAPGEQVVTDGQLRLAQGARVQVNAPPSSGAAQKQ